MEPTPPSASPTPGTPQSAPPPPERLLRALALLLRPLVRLLIRAGITFPTLADLLRAIYVEIASHELLDPASRTDSRVSLMTGIHRKEIRRQRMIESPAEPQAVTTSSQVMARWLGAPALTGPGGLPIPLRRHGPAPSFEALVTTVTKDVRPRALLETWLDQGLATLDADGLVHLVHTAYVPQADHETKLFYFSRNLRDHLAAAAANIANTPPPFLDRSVHYDGLSPEAAARIEAAARDAATATLLEVNRQALAIADADDAEAAKNPGLPRRHRVNLGVYLLTEQEQDAAPR